MILTKACLKIRAVVDIAGAMRSKNGREYSRRFFLSTEPKYEELEEHEA